MPDEYGDSPSFEEGFDDGGNNEVPSEPPVIKLPTHNVEAERALIGSVLRDNNQFERCASIVKAADFSQAHHQLLWGILSEYHRADSPFDMVSISETLTTRGKIEELGVSREAYLYDCWQAGAITANATMYADIVKKHSIKRQQVHIANELCRDANSNMPPEELAERMARAVEELGEGSKPKGWSADDFIDMGDFADMEFKYEFLVDRVFLKNECLIIGGAFKVMKTNIMCDLFVSLASGTPFLGTYAVPRRVKVAMMSSESGLRNLQDICRRICEQRGITMKSLKGWGFIHRCQPKLSNPEEMARLAKYLKKREVEAVLFDPAYLSLTGGKDVDAANLFDMGPLYEQISKTCIEAGATPGLAFHAKKYTQVGDEPMELHDLTYSGIAEFSPSWILVKRREPHHQTFGDGGRNELVVAIGGRDSRAFDINLTIWEGLEAEKTWRTRVVLRDAAYRREQEADDNEGGDLPPAAAQDQAAAWRNYWDEVFSRCYAWLKNNDKKHEGMTYKGLRDAIDPPVHNRQAEQFRKKILDDARFEEVLVKQPSGPGFRDYPGIRLKDDFKQQEIFTDENG